MSTMNPLYAAGTRLFEVELGDEDGETANLAAPLRSADTPHENAGEFHIDAINQTVMEYTGCPADDAVVGCAYESQMPDPANEPSEPGSATVYHYPASKLVAEDALNLAMEIPIGGFDAGERERMEVFGKYSADLAAFERTARRIFENPETAAKELARAFTLDPAVLEQVANAEAVLDDYLQPGEREVEPEPGPSPPKSYIRPVRETHTPDTRGDCRYTRNDKYRPEDDEAIVCWQCSDKPNNRPREFRADDAIGTTFNETCKETVIVGQETQPRVLSRTVWDSARLDIDALPERLSKEYDDDDHWTIRGFIQRLRSDDEDRIRKAALRVSYEATLSHVEDYNYGRAAALLRDCGVDTDALFPGGDNR
jgi:hypothetical protein